MNRVYELGKAKKISCEFAFSEPFGVHQALKIYSELVELNKLYTDEPSMICKNTN